MRQLGIPPKIQLFLLFILPICTFSQGYSPDYIQLEVDSITPIGLSEITIRDKIYTGKTFQLVTSLVYRNQHPSSTPFGDSLADKGYQGTFYFEFVQIRDVDSFQYKQFLGQLYSSIKKLNLNHPSHQEYLENPEYWVSFGKIYEVGENILLFRRNEVKVGVGYYAEFWYKGYLYRCTNKGDRNGRDPSVDALPTFLNEYLSIEGVNLYTTPTTITLKEFIANYETNEYW